MEGVRASLVAADRRFRSAPLIALHICKHHADPLLDLAELFSGTSLSRRALTTSSAPGRPKPFCTFDGGVLITTFVLITRTRMAAQSDRRDHLNLQVDLLAEQEMTVMLRMLRRISERRNIEPKSGEDARAQRLGEETNVYESMQNLEKE